MAADEEPGFALCASPGQVWAEERNGQSRTHPQIPSMKGDVKGVPFPTSVSLNLTSESSTTLSQVISPDVMTSRFRFRHRCCSSDTGCVLTMRTEDRETPRTTCRPRFYLGLEAHRNIWSCEGA